MNANRYAVAIAAAIAAVGVAVPVADGFGDRATPSPASTSAAADPGPTAPDHAAIARARANIATLAEARQPRADAIPEQLVSGLLSDGAVALASARSVEAGGKRGWLASTSDGSGVCVLTAGAMTCPPVAHVVDGGLSAGWATRAGEPVHVFGVASDDVTDVALRLQDGTTLPVGVAENFFAVDLPAPPLQISWIGPDGPATQTLWQPRADGPASP